MYSGLRWDACSIKMYRVFRKIWYILLKSSKMQEYRNTMIFEKKTLFLQVYVNCSKKVFSHLQVCTIYLVNYYIRKLAHESKLFL